MSPRSSCQWPDGIGDISYCGQACPHFAAAVLVMYQFGAAYLYISADCFAGAVWTDFHLMVASLCQERCALRGTDVQLALFVNAVDWLRKE